jgi:hypothetical protein
MLSIGIERGEPYPSLNVRTEPSTWRVRRFGYAVNFDGRGHAIGAIHIPARRLAVFQTWTKPNYLGGRQLSLLAMLRKPASVHYDFDDPAIALALLQPTHCSVVDLPFASADLAEMVRLCALCRRLSRALAACNAPRSPGAAGSGGTRGKIGQRSPEITSVEAASPFNCSLRIPGGRVSASDWRMVARLVGQADASASTANSR